MGLRTASATRLERPRFVPALRTFGALAGAGFRRYATYRQATIAATVTNTVFGFLRTYVLLAVVNSHGGAAAGYRGDQLATFVWLSQGMLGTVLLWGNPELATRIRSGDVVTYLLRPIGLVTSELAADLGRAAMAALTRFVTPMVVGAIFFDLYAPRRLTTYPFAVLSLVLATVISFACRYMVSSTAYWLLDARGPQMAYWLAANVLAGLYFPLTFLPRAVFVGLFVLTPFPSLMQAPLDIAVERISLPTQSLYLAVQAAWAAAALAGAYGVQRRAERRLVVQGG